MFPTQALNTYEPVVEVIVPQTIEEKIEYRLGSEFIAIAECESNMRQFNQDGTVLISETSDKGLFQINQVHWERAEELDIDIDTVEGNIKFAHLLKEENGTGAWYKSEHCWNELSPHLTFAN